MTTARAHPRAIGVQCFALACCAVLTCCASSERSSDPERAEALRNDAHRVRGMLLKDENGLEVRQLVIADNPDTIADTMAHWASNSSSGIDAATAQRLRRNGFRLVRVPVDAVDDMVADLGGATLDVSSWHGQVLQWRDLHSLPLGETGRTVAVDGRVRRYEGGQLRLLARGWVVPMEDGPRVQLDLVPDHLRGESQYHRLLGQSRTDARPLPSLAAHVLLEPGYAYILTCECPHAQWGSAESDAQREESSNANGGMIGPDVQPPTTIGQLMLSSHAGRPSRGMLIFTPRIAAELFPPGEAVADRSRARDGASEARRR